MGSYTSIGIGGSQSHIEKLAEPMYQRPQNRTVNKMNKKSSKQVYEKNVFLLQKVAFCVIFVELQNENDFFKASFLLFTKIYHV